MMKSWCAVLVLSIIGFLAWGCKAESRQEPLQSKSNLQTKNIVAQGEKAPVKETAKEASEVSGKPKIVFEQTDYDFGKVDQGTKVEHQFLLKNTGDGTLVINNVRSSCGCTSALLTAKDVPPGGVGGIKASFESKGYEGQVKKMITVESNDPGNPTVRLTLQGTVVADVTVNPQAINFGFIRRGDPVKPVPLTILLREGKGLKVNEVSSDSTLIMLKKQKDTEHEVVYEVALAGKIPIGSLFGQITVETNNKKLPKVLVPFHATVKGNVKITPQIVGLGIVAPGNKVSQTLHISKEGDKPFTVTKVNTTSPQIKAEIVQVEQGTSYDIKLTFDPGDKAEGRVAERISIIVNDPEEEIVNVPVYGTNTHAGRAQTKLEHEKGASHKEDGNGY